MEAKPKATKPDAALLQELLEVGLEMQDRYAAEPVYARTGKGFLKSAGVEDLKRIKASKKATKP